ncbi:glycerophosphodiester phosphodiesterase [Bacillus marinisedimentorum]|uniref:glycerophosphodiester phosphodiesterase n=1 Tax=Bacillus marinisedimentorum TaxID=1821260 RepID=UPI0007E08DB3|nr:glycerophosphodiester phosphodiesterase [Bacillus marinisedimentorum]
MNKFLCLPAAAVLALILIAGSDGGSGAAAENDPTMDDEPFHVVGHRGVSGEAPEHTFAAYDLVKKQKGGYFEIDLRMTKDGELVAMHDARVERTTDGTGKVRNKTIKEIKELDAGSWFNEKYPDQAKTAYEGLKVPTLEEIFQRYGKDVRYYIETKSPDAYPGMEEKLLELIKEYQLMGESEESSNVIIQSFSKKSLLAIHELAPELPLIQLLLYVPDGKGSYAEVSGLTSSPDVITKEELGVIDDYAVGIGMNYMYNGKMVINEKYVHKARALDMLVHPYTVNDEKDMETLIDWNVTGMFTNYVVKLDSTYKEILHKQLRMKKKSERGA